MVNHIQTILVQNRTNCLSVFDHFVGLALKGLIIVFHVRKTMAYDFVISLD